MFLELQEVEKKVADVLLFAREMKVALSKNKGKKQSQEDIVRLTEVFLRCVDVQDTYSLAQNNLLRIGG